MASKETKIIETAIFSVIMTASASSSSNICSIFRSRDRELFGEGHSMDLFNNLLLGFSVALSFQNIGLVSLAAWWNADRRAAGRRPHATIAMLLPITFGLPPVGALIMLAASTTGRSTAARRQPFSSTFPARRQPSSRRSTATRWPSRESCRTALGVAALGSFFAGTVATHSSSRP